MFLYKWHPSWNELMTDNTISMLNDIEQQLIKDCGNNYYPEKKNVLRFLNNDASNIKCVIVGMEPYPSYNYIDKCPQATGRSFEVSELKNQTWDYKIKQSSIRNILKAIYYNEFKEKKSINEIREAISNKEFKIVNPDKWFDNMEEQGVLFLNSTLTYSEKGSNYNKKLWKDFREKLITFLSNKNVLWMLWGNDAFNEISPYIENKSLILKAPHPRLDAFVKQNTFQYVKDINWKGL